MKQNDAYSLKPFFFFFFPFLTSALFNRKVGKLWGDTAASKRPALLARAHLATRLMPSAFINTHDFIKIIEMKFIVKNALFKEQPLK